MSFATHSSAYPAKAGAQSWPMASPRRNGQFTLDGWAPAFAEEGLSR